MLRRRKKRVGVRIGIRVQTRVRIGLTTSGNTDNRGVRVDLSLGAKITLSFHRKFLNVQICIPNFSLCLYEEIMS